MNTRTSAIIVLVIGLLISGCASEQAIVPTLTSTPTFTPIPTQTFAPTATMTPTPTALATQCVQWNLSPEECANLGTHEYSTNTQVSSEREGQSCTVDNSNIVISIQFLSGETFLLTDPYRPELKFTREDQLSFSGGYTQPDGNYEWKSTITFTVDGFVEESSSYDLQKNELLCTFVWEQKIIGLAVTKTPIPPNSFKVYDSSTDKTIDEYGIRERTPDFSIKYPPQWQYGWFCDSGLCALIILPGNPSDAWSLQDTSGFTFMIIAGSYDGRKLTTDMFLGYESAESIVEEPSVLTINGQDAIRVEFINNGDLQIEVAIVRGKSAVDVVGRFQNNQETEFRAIFENMISTLEIK